MKVCSNFNGELIYLKLALDVLTKAYPMIPLLTNSKKQVTQSLFSRYFKTVDVYYILIYICTYGSMYDTVLINIYSMPITVFAEKIELFVMN